MRIFAVAGLLLVFCLGSVAKGPREYPVTFDIISTDSASRSVNAPVETECLGGVDGPMRCTTTGGTRQEVDIVQTANASDGNRYVIECEPGGVLSAFSTGAYEAGTAASGGTVHRGCQLRPGAYSGRFDKRGLKLLIYSSEGKPREVTFRVISVKKKTQ